MYNAAILRGRLRSLVHLRKRRQVRQRMAKAIGEGVSAEELNRLTGSAFGYREMARVDRKRLSRLRLAAALGSSIEEVLEPLQDYEKFALLMPAGLFTGAAPAALERVTGHRFAVGTAQALPSENRCIIVSPAPVENEEAFLLAADGLARSAAKMKAPVFGFHVIRAGLLTLRLAPPQMLLETGDSGRDDVLERWGQFLNDCLRENPAQYDWFAER